ncbi:hypothetical protein EVAR_90308_1 [Eumeta japonica]|uniref:Uncharacterized protein n=1 Tax=Eumeta variegata TaxID=151549 RepID=A0A4C1ZJX8_EUMVA|nr:hypothetical protein EVAR_90308_1 [Eumeta japonica]
MSGIRNSSLHNTVTDLNQNPSAPTSRRRGARAGGAQAVRVESCPAARRRRAEVFVIGCVGTSGPTTCHASPYNELGLRVVFVRIRRIICYRHHHVTKFLFERNDSPLNRVETIRDAIENIKD